MATIWLSANPDFLGIIQESTKVWKRAPAFWDWKPILAQILKVSKWIESDLKKVFIGLSSWLQNHDNLSIRICWKIIFIRKKCSSWASQGNRLLFWNPTSLPPSSTQKEVGPKSSKISHRQLWITNSLWITSISRGGISSRNIICHAKWNNLNTISTRKFLNSRILKVFGEAWWGTLLTMITTAPILEEIEITRKKIAEGIPKILFCFLSWVSRTHGKCQSRTKIWNRYSFLRSAVSNKVYRYMTTDRKGKTRSKWWW